MLTNNKNEVGTLGALAGAVIVATFKAFENAQKTNIPVYIEQDGVVYEISTTGEKKFIKKIAVNNKQIPRKYQLK